MEQPHPSMIAAAERIARFIETGEDTALTGAFSAGEVTILENFPPFLFDGRRAVERWAKEMRAHLGGLANLRHSFGPAHDFGRDGKRVFFCLPTTWRGIAQGRPFVEHGGWAFLLTSEDSAWRVRAYGWAVTGLAAE